MNTLPARMSEAEAHLELMLLDSHIAGTPVELFLDRFRRRDMLHQSVLTRIDQLLQETRFSLGRLIYPGKIVTNEILQFIERTPEVASGLQLKVALKTLNQLAPFLGPLLAALSAEVEAQGYGEAFRGTGFPTHLEREAETFFTRFATVLNMNKGLLQSKENGCVPTVDFSEPELFELEASADPFDLDDLHDLPPTTGAVCKFLIKLALAEGSFSDPERAFLARMLDDLGESLAPSQFERLVAEASKQSLDDILKAVEHESVVWKEKLLLSGMLMVAADGKVEVIEKKLLARCTDLLKIPRQRYSEIAREAVHIMKAFRSLPSKKDAADAPGPIETRRPVPALPSSEDAAPSSTGAPEPTGTRAVPHEPARREDVVAVEQEAAIVRSRPAVPAPIERGSTIATSHAQPETSVADRPKVWVCPACLMPQMREPAECPQCGIIVAKYLAIRGRMAGSAETEEFIEVRGDEPHAAGASYSEPVPPPEPPRPLVCTGCGGSLSAKAKFCPACGNPVAG